LVKLWARVRCLVFLTHGVVCMCRAVSELHFAANLHMQQTARLVFVWFDFLTRGADNLSVVPVEHALFANAHVSTHGFNCQYCTTLQTNDVSVDGTSGSCFLRVQTCSEFQIQPPKEQPANLRVLLGSHLPQKLNFLVVFVKIPPKHSNPC